MDPSDITVTLKVIQVKVIGNGRKVSSSMVVIIMQSLKILLNNLREKGDIQVFAMGAINSYPCMKCEIFTYNGGNDDQTPKHTFQALFVSLLNV